MSNKANPAAIGVFVLGAMVLAVVSVVMFGSGRLFSQTEKFILYFDDSLNGLDIGAPVKFKGVPIGEVTDIFIRLNQSPDSPHIPVIIQIDTEHLQQVHNVQVDLANSEVFAEQVNNLGLRGSLQQASFVTGKLFVELDYYADAPPPEFVQEPDPETDRLTYKEIPTLRSGLTEVIQKVSLMVNEISRIPFAEIGRKVDRSLGTLNEKLSALDVDAINAELVATLEQTRALLEDPEMVVLTKNLNLAIADYRKVAESLDATLIDARQLVIKANDNFEPLLDDLELTTAQARDSLKQAETLFVSLNSQVSPGSPLANRLDRTLWDIGQAAQALRTLADYLERNPNAIITGKPKP